MTDHAAEGTIDLLMGPLPCSMGLRNGISGSVDLHFIVNGTWITATSTLSVGVAGAVSLYPPLTFRDSNGNKINNLTFESIYAGHQSGKQLITAHNDTTSSLTVTLTPSAGDNQDGDAIDTYNSIYLSSDDSSYSTSLVLTIPSDSSVDFYIYYSPPSDAKIGEKEWKLAVTLGSTISEWLYVNSFDLTNITDEVLSDYIIVVTVPYAAGKMQTNFDDIRFHTSLERLDSTLDWKVDSSTATFLVRGPVLRGGETKTIYIYGGHTTVAAIDDQAYTAHFDWLDGTLLPWTKTSGYQSNINTTGFGHFGLELISATIGPEAGWTTITTPNTGAYGRWTYKFRLETTAYTDFYFDFIRNSNADQYKICVIATIGAAAIVLRKNSTDLGQYDWTADTNSHDITITRDLTGAFTVYFDGTEVITATDNTITTSEAMRLNMYSGNWYRSAYVDYINFVEYTADPPTIGALTGWLNRLDLECYGGILFQRRDLPGLEAETMYGCRIGGVYYD